MALAASLPAGGQVAVLDRDPLEPGEVDQAIESLQGYLRSMQDADGTFDSTYREGAYQGGATALATLALLESGVSTQDPAVLAAVRYLRSLSTEKTYVRSLRLQVYARLPDAYLPDLRRDLQWFTQAHHQGTFHYQPVARLGEARWISPGSPSGRGAPVSGSAMRKAVPAGGR